ncbi:MAG TPA: DegV family protein [Firmicutes bacterium]|nr:DegV family protein [Candidatus Fermentithermobacillaceae bacterium]
MSNIAVVTDSTSDIPRNLAEQYGISVIPLSVIHEGVIYRDGIDLTSEQFYPMLEKAKELPTSSQPSPRQFIDIFKPLVESGKEVLSFHLSKALSSTVDSARLAAEQLAPGRIHIVDTGSISYGIAVQAIEAARLAMAGYAVPAILECMARLKKQSEVLFSLDTLHYLHKGGRIGKVSSLLGNLLNIKPIVHVEDGVYVPIGKVRSIKHAIAGMVDFLAQKFGKNKVLVGVGHGQALDYAKCLIEQVVSRLNIVGEPVLFEVGPVIGVHTGPGTVGISVHPVAY